MAVIAYQKLCARLSQEKYTWLVTGAAGFIGSHLVEQLLRLKQQVIGLDNFATGYQHNLQQVLNGLPPDCAQRFHFIEGDIRDLAVCQQATQGVDIVLHQAALGSVPRSIKDPLATHAVNVDGFVNMLAAAKENNVRRFVYASSSSVYGDSPVLPKAEHHLGQLLSPYAVSKMTNELYGKVFTRCYDFPTIGLRYFNVFGTRQSPEGPYAAVIPRWVQNLLADKPALIYGDGTTTRDFCFVDNAVQANLLAAMTDNPAAFGQIYNIAVGQQTSLNELYKQIALLLGIDNVRPVYQGFRPGDIKDSLADITLAKEQLGYVPTHTVRDGLGVAMAWYKKQVGV